MLALLGAAPASRLDVSLVNLRSDAGEVRLCLTRDPAYFPDCKGDPLARHVTAPAAAAGRLRFSALPTGSYALSVLHDENGNGRLDSFAGIPREGFGFSRNPAIRFGPPHFDQARFTLGIRDVEQVIQMRYML